MSVEAISWALNWHRSPADRGGQPSSACKFVLVGWGDPRPLDPQDGGSEVITGQGVFFVFMPRSLTCGLFSLWWGVWSPGSRRRVPRTARPLPGSEDLRRARRADRRPASRGGRARPGRAVLDMAAMAVPGLASADCADRRDRVRRPSRVARPPAALLLRRAAAALAHLGRLRTWVLGVRAAAHYAGLTDLATTRARLPSPVITDLDLRPAPRHVRFVERWIAGATHYLRMRATERPGLGPLARALGPRRRESSMNGSIPTGQSTRSKSI